MPAENQNKNTELYRERAHQSDTNTLLFYKNIVRTYHEMGLLSDAEKDAADGMTDVDAVNKIIAKVPEMTLEQRLEFCDRFVGDDLVEFNGATPAILAYAYRATFARAQDDQQKERLQRIAEHIDALSADFAKFNGMVINSKVVDTTNIADVYEGFADMLRARMGDLSKTDEWANNARRHEMQAYGVALSQSKIDEMNQNFEILDKAIDEYDDMWGLHDINPQNVARLEKRWDKLDYKLARAEISEETKEILGGYKFLGADGNVVPQFKSGKRNDETEYQDYETGRKIIKGGRLDNIIELARNNVAKRHAGQFDEEIDSDSLEQEFNDEVLFLLYSMSVADNVIGESTEHPEIFMDYTKRDEILENFAKTGGTISDIAYSATLHSHVNATGGYLARIKSKVGSAASKPEMERFIDKVYTLNSADARVKKRVEMLKRILKGFASAFIASAIITVVATAAAAAAGMSVAAGFAIVGVVTTLGIALVQVNRWRKAQQAAGKPTDIHAFLADKRLVTSLGISAIAIAAMCFGAAGFATAAMALGYGALALGGVKNTIEAYRDARRNMSVAESLVWAIANASAIAAGGILGRYAARSSIAAYNEKNPENTIFQQEETHTEQREFSEDVEHEKVVTDYTDEMTQGAERAVKMWYKDDPELLQQRIDAIEAYNATHDGIDINPYRALRIIALAGEQTPDNMLLHVNNSLTDPNIHDVYSHGMHGAYNRAGWQQAYGYSAEDINLVAHAFNPDGTLNPDAMEIIQDLDLLHLGTNGTVGYVEGREYHNDGVLKTTDVARGGESSSTGRVHSVYSPVDQSPTQHTETYTTTETVVRDVDVTTHTPVDAGGMAMFGNYNPRQAFKRLRDRVGSFVDKIRGNEDIPVPVRVRTLWVERSQAKNWVDWHASLDTVREKRSQSPHGSRAADLARQEKDLLHKIEHLYNQLGRASDEEIERGIAAAFKREEMHKCIDQIERLKMQKPNPARGISQQDIDEEIRKTQEKYDNLVKELETYDYYRPVPVKGVQAQKKEQRRKEREQAQEKQETRQTQSNNDPEKEVVDQGFIPMPTEPQGNKEELESIDWARYQRPFVFDHEEIQADNPFDLRRNMNLSDNRVRDINVGELLRKQDSAVQKHAPQLVETQQNEPETQVAQEIKPVQTSVMEHANGNKDMDAMLDAAYRQAISSHEGRSYFVPDALTELVERGTSTGETVGLYNGTPVNYVDINNGDNPIAKTQDSALVVVELSGMRIPFYIATGMNTRRNEIPGHWYPASNMTADGIFYTPSNVINNGDLMEIAGMLDEKIGDIRNWQDDKLTGAYNASGNTGFIGGCDVAPDMDTDHVYELLENSVYSQPGSKYDNHQVYGFRPSNHELFRDEGMVAYALREIRELGKKVKEDVQELGNRVKAGAQELRRRLKARFGGIFHRDPENDM